MSSLIPFWSHATVAVIVSLFLLGLVPNLFLRLIVKVWPKDDPVRKELLANLEALPAHRRPFYVLDQLLNAFTDGLHARLERARSHRSRPSREKSSLQRRERFSVLRAIFLRRSGEPSQRRILNRQRTLWGPDLKTPVRARLYEQSIRARTYVGLRAEDAATFHVSRVKDDLLRATLNAGGTPSLSFGHRCRTHHRRDQGLDKSLRALERIYDKGGIN